MLRTRKVQLYLLLTLLAFSTFTVRAHAYSVNVQLTGAGGAEYGLGSNYAYGEYVMPYYLSINGATPTAVICDDFLHTVSVGDQWTAAVSNLGGDLSQTRFGAAHSLQYKEAVWIAAQINSHSSLTDIAAAQFAIWRLLTPGTPDVFGEASWIAAAQAAASSNFAGMNFANWIILTPQNPLSPQEYFYQIPEPGIYLDLGFGLLACLAMWKATRKRESALLS